MQEVLKGNINKCVNVELKCSLTINETMRTMIEKNSSIVCKKYLSKTNYFAFILSLKYKVCIASKQQIIQL